MKFTLTSLFENGSGASETTRRTSSSVLRTGVVTLALLQSIGTGHCRRKSDLPKSVASMSAVRIPAVQAPVCYPVAAMPDPVSVSSVANPMGITAVANSMTVAAVASRR